MKEAAKGKGFKDLKNPKRNAVLKSLSHKR